MSSLEALIDQAIGKDNVGGRALGSTSRDATFSTQSCETEGHLDITETARALYLTAAHQVFENVVVKAVNDLGDDIFERALAVRPFPSGVKTYLEVKNTLLDKVELANPQIVGYFALELEAMDNGS